MFDIGFSELIVIAVVALVVIGPERLPKVARTIGHLLGKAQRYVNDVKTEINREMEIDELRRLQAEMQEAARKLETNVHQTMRETEDSVQQSVKAIEDDVAMLEKQALPDQPNHSGSAAKPEGPVNPDVSTKADASVLALKPVAESTDSIRLDPSDYNPAEKDGPILLSDAGPEPEQKPEAPQRPVPATPIQIASEETSQAGSQKS